MPAVRPMMLIPAGTSSLSMISRSSSRSSPSTRRDTPPPRGLFGISKVAPGKADEGGERGALVAALVLLDLDDQFLAFIESVLDPRAADVDAGLEILARDFLEGKKSVPLGAVVHERGFEAGLDPGDDTLVDVAFSLFFCGRFYVEVYEFLAFDNSDTEFLGLCRVKEHALHCFVLPRARAGQTKSLVSIG